MMFDRASFLAGSFAVIGAGLATRAGATPPAAGSASALVPPQRLLDQLMAGNKRFVAGDFPAMTQLAEKREQLVDTQAPFAAILTCADSRVIPNLIFVQGIGDLFVARVAGNYPDDLVTGSIEYAIEHLGTRLVMVLGHQNCGAIKAVYSAIQTKVALPPHLAAIQHYIAPGIEHVVAARGTQEEAIAANVRAAVTTLKSAPPALSKGVTSGRVLVVGGVYQLGSGEVKLLS